jgi:hypothetical protein
VLVRTDIPLADQIVQVGHACLEAGWQFAPPAVPCHLVVLAVLSEAHLHAAIAAAALAGIRCVVFHEPDDELGATAACSEPITGVARRVFRRLPLWSASAALEWARGPPVPPFLASRRLRIAPMPPAAHLLARCAGCAADNRKQPPIWAAVRARECILGANLVRSMTGTVMIDLP